MKREFAKNIYSIKRNLCPYQDEQGLALVMALILGMVLMAGVSGLLTKQLMSRRLSAKES